MTIGPTVQKSVWVSGGDGDDRIINRSGTAILVDKTEQGSIRGVSARNDVAAQAFDLGTITADRTLAKLTIDSPDDTDFYKFRLSEKASLSANITLASLNTADDKFNFQIFTPDDLIQPKAEGTLQVLLAALDPNTDYLLRIVDDKRPTIYDLQFNLDGDSTTIGEVTHFAIAIGGIDAIRRDVLLGGAGDDVLSGGADEDFIFGEDGRDVITGGLDRGASDLLFGGNGDDTCRSYRTSCPSSVAIQRPSSQVKQKQGNSRPVTNSTAVRGRTVFCSWEATRTGVASTCQTSPRSNITQCCTGGNLPVACGISGSSNSRRTLMGRINSNSCSIKLAMSKTLTKAW